MIRIVETGTTLRPESWSLPPEAEGKELTMDNTTKLFIKALLETDGRIFRATFVKKDGTVREMVGRTGVQKGVNGNGMSFDPIARGLMPIFDMQKKAWRMVNAKTMTNLKCGGLDINLSR